MKRIEGVGIGLRSPHAAALAAADDATAARVDWLEITPENWMHYGGARRRLLDRIAERWPIVPHGVSLDVGGGGPLEGTFLDATRALVGRLDAPFWSDHVCFSSLAGRPLHDLLPLPFSGEAVGVVGERARAAAARVERPLVLENATFYAHMPGGEMDEADFLRACLDAAGTELLLDVNNVVVNARNHGGDPRAFVDRMPLERVRYLHVAGHTRIGEVVIDTHVGPVPDEVWALYRHTLARAGRMIPTLVEWDQDIPALEVVLAEADRARAEAARALAAEAA